MNLTLVFGVMMLRSFTSYDFSPQGIRSASLKVAVVLSLGFLLPVAMLCQEVERRYQISRYKRSMDRGVSARPSRLVRKMYVFVKLSGLSDFSAFLLSSAGRGKMHETCCAPEQPSSFVAISYNA